MLAQSAAALLAALLVLPSLATATTAGPRLHTVAGHSYSNPVEGRRIAAPPWSAACMTDHGPSECGEPMWIYGPRNEMSQYRSAF
ncbi:hypothetical protein M2427_001322 [Bradyrhizobium sp. BR13661]|nr:hypothetical protein [Bradyrhizobium sp. BR13661]